MRSGKSLSSIAYHRASVFATITNGLRKSGAIGPALWIPHKGEGGDKDHIHLLLLGGFKTYNTEGLGSLWGFDIEGDEKRSVSALWRTTKNTADWLLYCLHDPKYLALKGLERECAYDWADMRVTEGDEGLLDELRREALDFGEGLGDKTTRRLVAMAKRDMTWKQVVLSGLVPMGQLSQAAKAWAYIAAEYSPSMQEPPRRGGAS